MISRPIPVVTAESATYWSSAARGDLLLGQCTRCNALHHPPQAVCPRCWSQTSAVRSGGTGYVEAFSVVHRNSSPEFATRVPYVVAYIRLDEGPALTSNVVACAPELVEVGMRVKAVFEQLSDDVAVPLFEPEA